MVFYRSINGDHLGIVTYSSYIFRLCVDSNYILVFYMTDCCMTTLSLD